MATEVTEGREVGGVRRAAQTCLPGLLSLPGLLWLLFPSFKTSENSASPCLHPGQGGLCRAHGFPW